MYPNVYNFLVFTFSLQARSRSIWCVFHKEQLARASFPSRTTQTDVYFVLLEMLMTYSSRTVHRSYTNPTSIFTPVSPSHAPPGRICRQQYRPTSTSTRDGAAAGNRDNTLRCLSFVPTHVGLPHLLGVNDWVGCTFHCLSVHSLSVFGCFVSLALGF
jgi:hypothetical protein